MESGIFIGVNLPCALLGLLVNMFYVFCLKYPPSGEVNVREPLMALLMFMIAHTSAFQLLLIILLSLDFTALGWKIKHALEMLIFYMIRISIPTSLYLNIFYCTQIVPARMAPLMWLKKNIRDVVYVLLISTKIFLMIYLLLEFLTEYTFSTPNSNGVNGTTGNSSNTIGFQISPFLNILNNFMMVLTLLNLCIMLTATGATGHYLYQHIKRMTNSGTSFQSQLLQNQVRVTITGLIQGFLHFLCSAGMFLEAYCTYKGLTCDQQITWMLFDLYSLATTFNLGLGQSLFRQQVARVCQKGGCCLPSA